jgi:hypothetical protein
MGGNGQFIFPDGSIYSGGLKDNRLEGKGKLIYANRYL